MQALRNAISKWPPAPCKPQMLESDLSITFVFPEFTARIAWDLDGEPILSATKTSNQQFFRMPLCDLTIDALLESTFRVTNMRPLAVYCEDAAHDARVFTCENAAPVEFNEKNLVSPELLAACSADIPRLMRL